MNNSSNNFHILHLNNVVKIRFKKNHYIYIMKIKKININLIFYS